MRILRIQEVSNITGLSQSSIYKQIRLGEFPPSVKITKRASGWDAEAVYAWVSAKLGRKFDPHAFIEINRPERGSK
jgi:prophage regulatory protein